MKVKRYMKWAAVLWLGLAVGACSDKESPDMQAKGLLVEVDYARFTADGAPASAPGENDIRDMKACFFKNGRWEKTFDLKPEEGKMVLEVSGNGNLYFTANMDRATDWEKVKAMTEDEWGKMAVENGEAGERCFLSAKMPVGSAASSVPKVVLKRGVARFDLKFEEVTAGVSKVRFLGIADRGFLFEQTGRKSPEGVMATEKQISFTEPQTSDLRGMAYVYEQEMENPQVEVTFQEGKVVTMPLPKVIKRNAVYTLLIQGGTLKPSLKVDEWDEKADMGMEDEVMRRLTVDEGLSALEGKATLVDENTGVSISYAASEIIVAVNCDEELVPANEDPRIQVELVDDKAPTLAERNRFRIKKELFVPNRPSESLILKFRRKRFTEVYDEDCLKVNLEANPDRLEGLLAFDRDTYTCDFNRYVDNEVGVFTLADGKSLKVKVDENDPWLRALQSPDNPQKYVVEAGWKPNDVNADGRKQTAQVVITAKDGTQEVYTVERKNYGLPVTYFRGLWWCCYNARGNSRLFEHQILSSNDPAAQRNMSVYEYLSSCTSEEYMELWGWGYQGLSGEGLKVVYKDSKLQYEGFQKSVSGFIPTQDPKSLAPEGYELVDMSDYIRILKKGPPMKMDVSEELVSTEWSDQAIGEGVFVGTLTHTRADLSVGGEKIGPVNHLLVTSPYLLDYGIPADTTKGITIYGPGSQWDDKGIVHKQILITAHSSVGEEIYNKDNKGLIRQKGTADNCVRIMRFKKSKVNYIYGLPEKDKEMK